MRKTRTAAACLAAAALLAGPVRADERNIQCESRHFRYSNEGDADPLAPVVEGKAHAVLVTTPTPLVIVNHSPDRLFLPLTEPLQTTSTAAAIRKGDPDFLNFLNSWIAFQRENGWLAQRQQYWFQTTDWMKGL